MLVMPTNPDFDIRPEKEKREPETFLPDLSSWSSCSRVSSWSLWM